LEQDISQAWVLRLKLTGILADGKDYDQFYPSDGSLDCRRRHAERSFGPPSHSEYEVKAAFLYNFAKFVEWPAEAFLDGNEPILVCIVGRDPFGDILNQTLLGKTVNGKPVIIQRGGITQDMRFCHIVFISSSERKRLAQIMQRLNGASVLTVSEIEGFAELGGIINFTLEGNKVRFEINVTSAERARLRISSKLLALAKAIWSGPLGRWN